MLRIEQYNNDDYFQAVKDVYRIPYGDDIILFSPNSAAVMKANKNVLLLLDYCSFTRTYSAIVDIFSKNVSFSRKDLNSILDRLHRTGFLKFNDSIHSEVKCAKDAVAAFDIDTTYSAPHAASLHLTDDCNLNCIYCYNSNTRAYRRKHLDYSQWESVLYCLVDFGVKSFVATGGEPFLRTDLFRAFQGVREQGFETGVITNGTLLSRDNIELATAAFSAITISLDSHIESIHCKTRGVNTYAPVMRSVELLEEHNVQYGINAVVNRYNIDSVMDTKQFFRNYRNCTSVIPIMYQHTKASQRSVIPTFSQIDRHFFHLLTDLLADENCAIASNPKEGLLLVRSGCGVGVNECAIGSDGSLYPCRAMYDEAFNCGNLLDIPIKDIWSNSSVLKRVRHADRNRCTNCREADCDFFPYCLGGCFGAVYDSIGELKPWADTVDCYVYRRMIEYKCKVMIEAAERGKGVLTPL